MNKKELLEELDKAIKIKTVAYEQIKRIIKLHFGEVVGMSWRDACLESTVKRAKRIIPESAVIFREWNGAAVIVTKQSPFMRPATSKEIEGHNDWLPV